MKYIFTFLNDNFLRYIYRFLEYACYVGLGICIVFYMLAKLIVFLLWDPKKVYTWYKESTADKEMDKIDKLFDFAHKLMIY